MLTKLKESGAVTVHGTAELLAYLEMLENKNNKISES